MAIQHYFNKEITVRRLSTLSGYKTNFGATGTVDVHIQKMSREDDMALYGVFSATHKAWCDVSSDVQQGDRVTDSDGQIYDVVAVEQHDYGYGVQHLEVIMRAYSPTK